MCNEEVVETKEAEPVSDWAYSRLCLLQQVMELGYDVRDWATDELLVDLCHDVLEAFLLGLGADKHIEEVFDPLTDD